MEKRVAAYCRVSTLDQSTGVESQVRVLKTYCEQNNITNVEFFCNEGISGTKSSRPALDRMMLLKSGLSYRAVSTIAKCSHGSVSVHYRVKKLAEPEATRYETRNEEKRRLKDEQKAREGLKSPAEASSIAPSNA